MPRAIRKSVISRCSNRSGRRSSCRKRQSPRDNVLSSIRETLRSSLSANRYSPLRRESPAQTPTSATSLASTLTPPLTPLPTPPMMQPSSAVALIPPRENNIQRAEQQMENPRLERSQSNLASQKSMGLFEHGIRYIMLPLHLLQFCVWGSPNAQSSSEAKEKKTSPSNPKENDKKPSHPRSKNSTSSSKASSSSTSSSTTSKSSRVTPVKVSAAISSSTSFDSKRIVPISSSAVPSSSTPSTSSSSAACKLNASRSMRRNAIPRRILREETTDISSDDMVTANEDWDDSSNDQWSSAASVSSMDMSIDSESYGNFEKFSSPASCAMEEPMDVSIEESNFYVKQSSPKSPPRSLRANVIKSTVERKSETDSSSSSPEDKTLYQEYSDSSVDREIASIFQKACTSSSSDDEDYSRSNGRRYNPFVSRSSNFGPARQGSRFKEEICDAAIRKKRTSPQYEELPETQTKRINRSSSISRNELAIDMTKSKSPKDTQAKENSQEAIKSANQTDSAYSDEDVEMNSINESIIRLQSVHMQTPQESIVEWMDQDLDYVADTEDSNDDSPLPGRARNSPFSAASSASADQGFAERGHHQRELRTPLRHSREVSGLENSINDKINPEGKRMPLRDYNKNTEVQRSMLQGPTDREEVRTPLRDWNKISEQEKSMLRGQAVRKEVRTPLGNWNRISEQEKSMLHRQTVREEARTPLEDWDRISVQKKSMLHRQTVREEARTPLEDWDRISEQENSMLHAQTVRKEVRTPLGDWNRISEQEKAMLHGKTVRKEVRTPLGDWNRISEQQKLMLHGQTVGKEVRTPMGDWNEISRFDRSIKAQIPVPQEANNNLARPQTIYDMDMLNNHVQVAGRGPPGFPAVPQHPSGTSCHCGNPNCFYVPLALPAGVSEVNWARNYPKPPSPLRHLYYEYPEFMSPPAAASKDHQSPYVLVPVPANLLRQEFS